MANYTYFTVITVLIILFILLILVLNGQKRFPGAPILLECPLQQCPTNLVTGERICPNGNTQLFYNPSTEVCSTPFLCDNPVLPYAINSDLSTNTTGICETGVNCRCIDSLSCPEYVSSLFTAQGGNPYISLTNQRITFAQSNPSSYNTANLVSTGSLSSSNPFASVISYSNPVSFCQVPLEWLNRSIPGCNFADVLDATNITTCMTGNLTVGNPCLLGTLAFISSNSESFTAADINTVTVACVEGTPCANGFVNVFDTRLGSIVCVNINT